MLYFILFNSDWAFAFSIGHLSEIYVLENIVILHNGALYIVQKLKKNNLIIHVLLLLYWTIFEIFQEGPGGSMS